MCVCSNILRVLLIFVDSRGRIGEESPTLTVTVSRREITLNNTCIFI